MKLVLAEHKFLRESIAIISDLVSEVNLKFDKNKMELIAMDPATVAMVIFKLLSSAFTEYNINKEVNIAVNLDNLKQVLKRAKPTDVLTLELDENKNRLSIKIKGNTTRSFNLALLNLERSDQKIPDLKFPVKVKVPTTIFNEAIDDMDVISESVTLITEQNRFIIQSESKINSANVEVTNGDDVKIDIAKNEKIIARYSLDYLKKIAKGCKLSEVVTLYYDKEYPLKVEYKVLDRLDLSFILAPRVSAD